MGLLVKVEVLKFHTYEGVREIGEQYSLPTEKAKKLVDLGKVSLVKEKESKSTETPKV